MKRFYKTTGIGAHEGGFAVLLDGRPVRTPERRILSVPTPALAETIAAEWEAQEETVKPATMTMASMANTAIDRVTPQRDHVVDLIARYAETDLVCYRAETPSDLAARQAALWDPALEWCRFTHGADLATTTGIMPIPQDPSALAAVRAAVAAHDDWRLAGLHELTTLYGSVVLALAVTGGLTDADSAFAASQVDESYQAELWGEEAEATKRRTAMRADAQAAARFLALVRAAP